MEKKNEKVGKAKRHKRELKKKKAIRKERILDLWVCEKLQAVKTTCKHGYIYILRID